MKLKKKHNSSDVYMYVCIRDERALSVSVSVNHMNYLYLYLYSEWTGPNPEVGGV